MSSNTLMNIDPQFYLDDKKSLVKMNSVRMRDDINVVYTQNLKDKMSYAHNIKSMSIENVVENIEVNSIGY